MWGHKHITPYALGLDAYHPSFQCQYTLIDKHLIDEISDEKPRYISEIAPPSIRGRLVGFYEIASQGAQMLGFWVNYAVNKSIDPNQGILKFYRVLFLVLVNCVTGMVQWQIPLGIQMIPGFALLCVIWWCPETPRWLGTKDRWEDAERVLYDLRQLPPGHPYVVNELNEVVAEVEFEAQILGIHPTFWQKLKQLRKKGIRNRLAIGLCLMM